MVCKMKIGRRTALARAIIMLDITRQNVEAKAPPLIMADLIRILKYHIGRLSPDKRDVLREFSFCLFFHKPDLAYQAMEGRKTIEIIGYGTVVSVSMKEYYMEKKIRLAIARRNLRNSGFFDLVGRVVRTDTGGGADD